MNIIFTHLLLITIQAFSQYALTDAMEKMYDVSVMPIMSVTRLTVINGFSTFHQCFQRKSYLRTLIAKQAGIQFH